MGAHVPLPLRDPRAELHSGAPIVAARRIRRRDAPAPRRDLGPPGRRLVPGVLLVVPRFALQRRRVVRGAPPRPVHPSRGDLGLRDPRHLRLDQGNPVLVRAPGVRRPWDPAGRAEKSTLNKVNVRLPATLFPWPLRRSQSTQYRDGGPPEPASPPRPPPVLPGHRGDALRILGAARVAQPRRPAPPDLAV